MEQGMGMMRGGNATSEENDPSLGRGLGVGSAREQAASNGPLSQKVEQGISAKKGPAVMQMQMDKAEVSKDANSVPGFPQDAFMEGPVMAMDGMFEKPETHGLRPGWSGFMQGMMTLIRVLPPEQYDEIVSLREKQLKNPHSKPDMQDHMQM
jgi:hypothetical protein